jgi:hypothetical protein
MPAPDAALTRLVSVLVPGGTLLVLEGKSDNLTPAQEAAREVHHFKAAVDQSRGQVHHFTFTYAEIISSVRQAGLIIEDVCEEVPASELTEEKHVERAMEFLDEYGEFAGDSDELQARRANVVALLKMHGFESPPHILVVARKPQI